MNKYGVLAIILILVSSITVFFEVPARISYSNNRMASYNQDDYKVNYLKTSSIKFNIDMESYTNHEEVLFNKNNLKLSLNSIKYTGATYEFRFLSKGNSTFTYGQIITLDKVKEYTIKSELGDLRFQLTGSGQLINDTIEYTFVLIPSEKVDPKKFINIKCNIELDGIEIKEFKKI